MFPAFLEKAHSEIGFDPDLCAWSFQLLEAKPSPNLFCGVVERLQHQYGISPEETIYVGNDKLNDIWPATQLGLKTALFAGDQRSLRLREDDTRCSNLEPDLIITELSQLPNLIKHR
jgi:putative hydrolase of the HAD superfamily